MAARAGLIVATGLLAATVTHAASSCDEEGAATGLEVGMRAAQLVVGAVTPESPAALSGLASGDVLLQANATVLRACGDWARAVRDARPDRKALLLLVRRGEGESAVVVSAGAWGPAAPGERGRPEGRSARALATPPPLPPAVPVSVPSVARALADLTPAEAAPGQLAAYRTRVADVRRQIETLDARHAASAEWLVELRRVVRLHEAAEVAWTAAETERERVHLPRHLPLPEETVAPYFEDSAPAAVLDELPLLRQTIAKEPRPGLGGEASGLWRPLQARRLLWEKARTDGAALALRPGAQAP